MNGRAGPIATSPVAVGCRLDIEPVILRLLLTVVPAVKVLPYKNVPVTCNARLLTAPGQSGAAGLRAPQIVSTFVDAPVTVRGRRTVAATARERISPARTAPEDNVGQN